MEDDFAGRGTASSWPESDSIKTQIVPGEVYWNPQGDLAGSQSWKRVRKRKKLHDEPIQLPSPAAVEDTEMDNATQPATQPYFDPRRLGRNNSDVSDGDAADVICILHPNSPAAHDAVRATMLFAPQHILQNEDLEHLTEDDLILNPGLAEGDMSRDIALRFSSDLKDPTVGFVFGREKSRCDILLIDDDKNRSVSGAHFKIFLNNQGTLMLQDTSMNGTIIDDEHLRFKDAHGRSTQRPPTRTITSGSLITVIGRKKQEVKFLVRSPRRGDHEGAFRENLVKYISAYGNGQVAVSSVAEHTYGMHWHGGSDYNVTGLLGKGAFAMVYKLTTKKEGHAFAAKELEKRRFLKNGVVDLKVDNEMKIMRSLRHPNIVQYVDCQDYDQWIYIIMEYVPYGELSKYLQERGSIPEAQVRTITRQILHALQYLHRRNITHRDIKPDNILIASLDPLVVKLSDFGLSKCVQNEETFLKTFCGTLLYCAPEIYPGYASYQVGEARKRHRLGEPAIKISPYDQSVDMWSFAAVLFHLLCGKAPITGRGENKGEEMLYNIMTKEVDFEPLREKGVSEMAIDFLGQLLNRNPHLRPKEAKCFQHPWIRDLPDVIAYEDDDQAPEIFEKELEAVPEIDEDSFGDEEEDALRAAFELEETLANAQHAVLDAGLSPHYSNKRRRLSSRLRTGSPAVALAGEIAYPVLPTHHASPAQLAPPAAPRLFGEITPTPSVRRSSGVFTQQPSEPADLPAIRDRVQQISVNDSGTSEGPEHSVANLHETLQYPHTLPLPFTLVSAPSLFGAEAQIGQLNMGSPEAGASEGTSPDETHPATPNTREATPPAREHAPSDPASGSAKAGQDSPDDIKFSRVIDLDLLEDQEAFAAAVKARDMSRQRKAEKKRAQTFQAGQEAAKRRNSVELARTIDATTGQTIYADVSSTVPPGLSLPATTWNPTTTVSAQRAGTTTPSTTSSNFLKPLPRLGKLTPTASSFLTTPLYLASRLTSWGRDPRCTISHPDKRDARIPKRALQLTFWAPGIEEMLGARSVDGRAPAPAGDTSWLQVPGLCTIISTSTSRGIWVNGVHLTEKSADGEADLWGKVYTGDVVTVARGPAGAALAFRVEIGVGDSARARPEAEKGFLVQAERTFARKWREEKEQEREREREKGLGLGRETAAEKEKEKEITVTAPAHVTGTAVSGRPYCVH